MLTHGEKGRSTLMKTIPSFQCEGCGQIFRTEDLKDKKTIGLHEWNPPAKPDLWSSVGFFSYSEEECMEQMSKWNEDQQDYENRTSQKNQIREENMERVLERCRQDNLLRQLISDGDIPTAKSRIAHLCTELDLWIVEDLAPSLFNWNYWLADWFYPQCFDAAQGKI